MNRFTLSGRASWTGHMS